MTSRLRPTYDELRAAGAREEREAVIEFIRDKIADTQSLKGRGRVSVHEAKLLTVRLDAIADSIGQGLHR